MKKVISIFLIFLLVFMPAVFSYNQAHGIPFALPLGVKLFGAICTALGVSFATVAGIKATYDLWAGNLPSVHSYLPDKIYNEASRVYGDVQAFQAGTFTGDIASLGRANVSEDVVSNIRSFVQSEFSVGRNVKQYIPATKLEDFPVSYNMESYNNLGADIIIDGIRYYLDWVLDYGGYGRYRLYIDGVQTGTFIDSYAFPYFSINYSSVEQALLLCVIVQKERYNTSTKEFERYWEWARGIPLQEDFVLPGSRSIEYTGADVLGIPDFWELEGDGVHEIAFPLLYGDTPDLLDADLERLLDMSYGEAIAATPGTYGLELEGEGDGVVVPPITGGFLEGLLGGLFGGIRGILDNILDFLVSIFAPPDTFELDFSPLRNLGISTKFPFCLPFDIQKAIGQLVSPAQVPRFEVTWKAPGYDGVIAIDFSVLEKFALITRWGSTVVFSMGLILITRKVLS